MNNKVDDDPDHSEFYNITHSSVSMRKIRKIIVYSAVLARQRSVEQQMMQKIVIFPHSNFFYRLHLLL